MSTDAPTAAPVAPESPSSPPPPPTVVEASATARVASLPTAPATQEPPSRLGVVATVLTVAGAVALAFAVFAIWGTAVLQQRDQDRLRAELAERFVVDRASADTDAVAEGAVVDGGFGTAEEDPDSETGSSSSSNEPEELGPVQTGDALALLRIPALDLDQVVVEGSGAEQLRSGPGHLRGTPRPGQKGNVVIAGKRATYGAPFSNLDQLDEGDLIELGTGSGIFVYRVTDIDTLRPERDEDVVDPTEDNRLTLLSAHPRYSADERLAVIAEFVGEDEGAPLRSVPAGLEPGADELGTGRDPQAAPSIVLFALLLAAAGAAFVWARRRWTGWALWAVFLPVFLALSVMTFESVLRWFPSTV